MTEQGKSSLAEPTPEEKLRQELKKSIDKLNIYQLQELEVWIEERIGF